MDFWLGTSHPHWLWNYDIKVMVSARALNRYKGFKRAITPWFRDGGGFTQLQQFGSWDNMPLVEFASQAQLHYDEIGNIAYISPQDWMCEPIVINGGFIKGIKFVGTKKSIPEHQILTVVNYINLMMLKPDLPWIPVIQGWDMDDYLRCVDMYYSAGIELHTLPLIGVGTICRRQGTVEATNILRRLQAENLKLHAFGLKNLGIPEVAPFLESSDSMAWSYDARKNPPLPECEAERILTNGKSHLKCNNCPRYATKWLEQIQRSIDEHETKQFQSTFAF